MRKAGDEAALRDYEQCVRVVRGVSAWALRVGWVRVCCFICCLLSLFRYLANPRWNALFLQSVVYVWKSTRLLVVNISFCCSSSFGSLRLCAGLLRKPAF